MCACVRTCVCVCVCVWHACMHACVHVFVVWVVCGWYVGMGGVWVWVWVVCGWCVGMGVCVGVVCALSLCASVSE